MSYASAGADPFRPNDSDWRPVAKKWWPEYFGGDDPVPPTPFLVFLGDDLVSAPGWQAYAGAFDTLEAARKFALDWVDGGVGRWCQIVDYAAKKIVCSARGTL